MNLKRFEFWLGPLLIIFVGLGIYVSHVSNPLLHYDDLAFARTVLPLARIDFMQFLSSFTIGHYFPVTNLTLLFDNSICGEKGTCYHLTSLVFHILNALLVFIILWREFKIQYWISVLAALLFVANPALSEAVYWMAARCNVVQLFFSLLTIWMFARYRRSEKTKYLVATFVLYVLALLAKESAIAMLPIFLVAWPWKREPLRKAFALLPFLLVSFCLVYLMLRFNAEGGAHMNDFAGLPLSQRLWMGFEGIIFYLQRGFFTAQAYAFYDVKTFVLEWWQWLVAALWIPLLYLSFRQDRALTFLCMLWFGASVGPILKIIPYGESSIVNDHYLYGPWIALGLVLALAARNLAANSRVLKAIAAVVLAGISIEAFATYQLGEVWSSGTNLWEHALINDPRCALAMTSIGIEDLRAGNAKKARAEFGAALEQRPEFVPALLNLAIILRGEREFNKAFDLALKARDLYPGMPDVHEVLGALASDMGHREAAIQSFQECVRMAGFRYSCSLSLARVLVESGQCAEAEPSLKILRASGDVTPEIQKLLSACPAQ